jgi:hypothetical protein
MAGGEVEPSLSSVIVAVIVVDSDSGRQVSPSPIVVPWRLYGVLCRCKMPTSMRAGFLHC